MLKKKICTFRHENQDIEEGADRILTQVLAPRSLSIFEPKIAVAVDEYLGIKNEAPPIELNGMSVIIFYNFILIIIYG